MTLRESSVPDAWLESTGHHKSAEMSGRQSSLSGGHAVWMQINLGSVLSLSGRQGQSQGWAQGLTAQENLGFAIVAPWGQRASGQSTRQHSWDS